MGITGNYGDKSSIGMSMKTKAIAAGLAVLLVVAIIGTFSSMLTVDAGEACVVREFGDPQGVMTPGVSWEDPWGRSTACYTTRSLVYETVDEDPAESGSKADYVDWAVDGVTTDGQNVRMTFTVRYRIDSENLLQVHRDIGPDTNSVNEKVVKFHSRTIVPHIINQHTANELYLGGLNPVSEEIYKELQPRFAESGVVLEYFELKRPMFSEEYTNAVEQKQLRTEEAAAARNEQEVVKAEAESKRIAAQGDADVQVIRAEGNAEALRIEGKAYEEYPQLLQVRGIEALSTANLVVVPSDSMPIVDLSNSEPVATPEP